MLSPNDTKRAESIITAVVQELNLNLQGLTVLTEAGSNLFLLTPVIALFAGAKVLAWTRDSSYGKAEDIARECENLISQFNLPHNIEFALNERPTDHVAKADIITNSGFVRPIDEKLLSGVVKNKIAIPLMYESWEWRNGEIDKNYCEQRGFLIGGTWENHPSLRIFDYCGQLAIKMLHEAGLEVFQNRIVIWSGDHFGEVIGRALLKAEARIAQTNNISEFYREIDKADAAFFCDFHDKRTLFGENGILEAERIASLNPSLKVIHLLGEIETERLRRQNLDCYPQKNGYAQTMTFTLAHLGMAPLIKLQAGGLKVAECLYRNIEHSICQKILPV